MRTFWERERPSSSDDEIETAKTERESEIRELEYRIINQENINSQLKSQNEAMKNQRIKLEEELANFRSYIKRLESENLQHERDKQEYTNKLDVALKKLQSSEDRYFALLFQNNQNKNRKQECKTDLESKEKQIKTLISKDRKQKCE